MTKEECAKLIESAAHLLAAAAQLMGVSGQEDASATLVEHAMELMVLSAPEGVHV